MDTASGVSTVAEIDHQPTGQDSMVLVSSLGSTSYGFTVINKLSSAFSVVARRLNGQNGNLELQYIRLPRTAALLESVAERVTNRVSIIKMASISHDKVFDGPFVKEVQQFYKENYGQTLIQYDLKNTMGRVVEVRGERGERVKRIDRERSGTTGRGRKRVDHSPVDFDEVGGKVLHR